MGLLDDMLGSAVPGGNITKPLMLALAGLLASGVLFRGSGEREAAPQQPGGVVPPAPPATAGDGGLLDGLGGLIDRFRQSGQGKVVDSWVGSGPNQPVSPGQVGNVLGSDVLKNLAARSGMSEEELIQQLSQILPGVVDKLTPQGRLPTSAELGPR